MAVMNADGIEILDEEGLTKFTEQDISLLSLHDMLAIVHSLQFYMDKCDELDIALDDFMEVCTCPAKEMLCED